MAQLSVTKHVKSSEAGEVAGLQGVFYGECVLRELRREDQGFDEADFFTGFVSRGLSFTYQLLYLLDVTGFCSLGLQALGFSLSSYRARTVYTITPHVMLLRESTQIVKLPSAKLSFLGSGSDVPENLDKSKRSRVWICVPCDTF
ncbi:hypothetical protein Bca52824_035979 [Brassica carinata]|uniref:Uncharacterized protein n=1 Tax=Brassica carinata TaxID=52824 RepID=A0A8X7V299_BRACI|nr:hypothetical protein Bca52824_035979 [Brassica carinata]